TGRRDRTAKTICQSATMGSRSCVAEANGSTSTIVAAAKPTGHHILKIDGYSRTKAMVAAGDSIDSCRFHVGDHAWRIRYYPNGTDRSNQNPDAISVMLELQDATAAAGRNGAAVKAQFVFSLLDEEAHLPQQRAQLPFLRRIQELGIPPIHHPRRPRQVGAPRRRRLRRPVRRHRHGRHRAPRRAGVPPRRAGAGLAPPPGPPPLHRGRRGRHVQGGRWRGVRRAQVRARRPVAGVQGRAI
ncbi:Os11g0630900, partial [Oryza sativa Japonica Group]